MKPKAEIDTRCLELQRQIEKAENFITNRKRQLIAIASIVFIASFIGYYFSLTGNHYFLAIMFAIIGASVGAAAGFIVTSGVIGGFAAAYAAGAAAGAAAGFVTVITTVVIASAIAAASAAVVAVVVAVVLNNFLFPLEELLIELIKEKDALGDLSPETSPQACDAHAK